MAKPRKRKKSPKLDMNPMVDLAFLLVTFFMLATTFKTEEPILLNLPAATTEVKMPETGIMTLSVSQDGRVFFNVDGKFSRASLLRYLGEKYQIEFSQEESRNFALMSGFGMPMSQMKSFLQLTPEQRRKVQQPGIPCDEPVNELADWIVYARVVNPRLRIAIKSDQETYYPHIEKVIQTLTEQNVLRFNLITEMKTEIK